MDSLDFSVDKQDAGSATVGSHDLQALVDKASMGTRMGDMYEVKDWEFSKKGGGGDTDDVIAKALSGISVGGEKEKETGGSMGALGSIFARLTGSKVLTDADLKPVLDAMKQHLMRKNVAMDIAEKVCEGVGEGLVGRKVGGFQSARFGSTRSFCWI